MDQHVTRVIDLAQAVAIIAGCAVAVAGVATAMRTDSAGERSDIIAGVVLGVSGVAVAVFMWTVLAWMAWQVRRGQTVG